MRDPTTWFAVGAGLILTLAIGLLSGGGGSARIPRGVGASVPEWEARDIDGRTVRSADLKGKVAILDFWTTWCPPCRREIPGFVSLLGRYGDQGLAIIGFSLDRKGEPVIREFRKEVPANYPFILGTGRIQAIFEPVIGDVEYYPTTLVVDRNGIIRDIHAGYEETETFEKEILPLLAEPTRAAPGR